MPSVTGWARATVKGWNAKATASPRPLVRRGYTVARRIGRDVANSVFGRQLGWTSTLRSARWTGPTRFEITGWTYERGYGYPDGPPQIAVWLAAGSLRVDAEVAPRLDIQANDQARNAEFDYANTAFTATFDLQPLLEHVGDPRTSAGWLVHVSVSGRGRSRSGVLRSRFTGGSAAHPFTHTYDDERHIVPQWSRQGLRFRCVAAEVVAEDVLVNGREVALIVRSPGAPVVSAAVQTYEDEVPLTCHPLEDGAGGRYRLTGSIPADYPVVNDVALTWALRTVVVRDPWGQQRVVTTNLDDTLLVPGPDATIFASSAGSRLRLNDSAGHVIVDRCDFTADPAHLVLHGRVLGTGRGARLTFVGSRQSIPVELDVDADGWFDAVVPLLVSVWGQRPLPPRTGTYVLEARDLDGAVIRVTCEPALTATTPVARSADTFRFQLQTGPRQQLRFRIGVARRPDELGSFHQRRLLDGYRRTTWAPRNAVYFESFYGRSSACNPRALDAEIAHRYPQLVRFWGVTDASVPVPDGAVAVIQGTREWWEARGTAQFVIANDWLRPKFLPQPFQVVLQTWHGSMLKRIGLDRPNLSPTKQQVILTERAKWDLLLSQNGHSTGILASAYAWDRPIMEEGYPRNDAMSTRTGEAVRAQLGIAPGQKAILYAPTWREHLTGMVTFLDLAELTRDLGDGYVILLRGHSRTVAHGADIKLPGVVDVTTHPDITQLFLAADAMITDYSSVMFDYSVTRRPIIFFVPDMDDYRDGRRGVYFDLSEVAPGPVLDTQADVTQAVRELAELPDRYRDRYDTWVRRFNHHDDGHVAERVVAQLMAVRK